MAIPNTTPTPNELFNGEMRKMSDTELRIVLIVTRCTLGWELNHETGMRKPEDWISQKQLMEKSGKSNRAISTSIKSCVEHRWIEARSKSGEILSTPEERSGKRVYYRLGRIFLSRLTSEDSSQVKPVKLTTETSEVNDIKPVNLLHSTKETITKENIQKIAKKKSSLPKRDPLDKIDLKVEINKMLANNQRHIHIIGLWLEENPPSVSTYGALCTTIKRNLRAARDLIGYPDKIIINAIAFVKDDGDRGNYDPTLETVIKKINLV